MTDARTKALQLAVRLHSNKMDPSHATVLKTAEVFVDWLTGRPPRSRQAVMDELDAAGWEEDTTDIGRGYWYKNGWMVAERRTGPPVPISEYVDIQRVIAEAEATPTEATP